MNLRKGSIFHFFSILYFLLKITDTYWLTKIKSCWGKKCMWFYIFFSHLYTCSSHTQLYLIQSIIIALLFRLFLHEIVKTIFLTSFFFLLLFDHLVSVKYTVGIIGHYKISCIRLYNKWRSLLENLFHFNFCQLQMK